MLETTASGTISEVKHVGTSRNGNPTYRITFTDGRSWLTGIDAGIGYAATNYAPDSREITPRINILTIVRNRVVDIKGPDHSIIF